MWRKLKCNFSELNLDIVLGSGQSFRWHKNGNNEWQGVLSGVIWTLKQDSTGNILYTSHNNMLDTNSKSTTTRKPKRQKLVKYEEGSPFIKEAVKDSESTLVDYFNLPLKLEDLYLAWSAADENFNGISKSFKGIRILRQDPIENLFSFICSANNNIPRITSMVENLCTYFGEEICCIEGKKFYKFPTIHDLAQNGVEETLRKLGFGYRAKYIYQTAKLIEEKHNQDWLYSLRSLKYEEAHNELVNLPGVGAKVADCICLMSLDKSEAIPVDTHIWQVTTKNYLPHLKNTKTLTPKIYKEIGDFYRNRFGSYAGWANTVLFAADLKKFKEEKKK